MFYKIMKIKQWTPLAILCFFAPSVEARNFAKDYEVPKGYTSIEACNGKEALTFWEMLEKRGALIGEDITLDQNDEKTTICNLSRAPDLVLFGTKTIGCYGTGVMEPWRPCCNDQILQGEGSYILYKGNLQNDGHICYMLVANGAGSGNYDHVHRVWKVIDDRIERLNMQEDLANTFFPGSDAHLFYGDHAYPFLIEKEGKVFMRWIDGSFPSTFFGGELDIGLLGIYTYYWEGNTFHYVPSLSKGDDAIIGPDKERQEYMVRFYESQKKAVSTGSEVIGSVNFENLKEFIHLLSKTDKGEKYPTIHLSKEGYFALKEGQGDNTRWKELRMQSDVSLESNDYDKYILYRGDFLNDSRDVFILIHTHNSLMFHDFEDTIWVWELSEGKLKNITLNFPTPWISHPFITKKEGKYQLHFVVKHCTYSMSHEDNPIINFPSTITYQFQGKDNLKPIR